MERTIVITGASDGLGAAAARALSRDEARVVVVGRTPEKVERVAAETGAEAMVTDFSRLAEVRRLADDLRARHERIDVLANNAGGIFDAREVTEDGHELTFQVNHLAPFLLTHLLLDRLVASRAVVVNTASDAHRRARLDLADLDLARGWSKWRAYSNSKLANILFTQALHQRYALEGLSAVSFHPGVVASGFGVRGRGATGWFYRSAVGRRVMVSPEQGADTLVWLAEGTPPRDWAPGQYYVDRRIVRPSKAARSQQLTDGLWAVSKGLLDLT